jgi:hypothetical protein
MRTVEHDGETYLLLKESEEACLVRDPATGEEQYLPGEELSATGEAPLAVAAREIPEPTRRLLVAVHTEQRLGLLLELDESPMSVREALGRYDLCESDLHGLFAELRAAGLLEEQTVGGERGYATTEQASEGLDALR